MNVLSIQSHVVTGRVGNRAAVFPLERMGINVWPLNTVQFSSHAAKKHWDGTVFNADELMAVVNALDKQGALENCDAIISGYFSNLETARIILDTVKRVKKKNPGALYCCDPVMGDVPAGLYVRDDIPAFFREKIIPIADILVPNLFETEILLERKIKNDDDALKAAIDLQKMGPEVFIMTSYPFGRKDSQGFLMADDNGLVGLSTDVLTFRQMVKGTGDLFASLYLGNYLRLKDSRAALKAAAESLFAILEQTLKTGRDELAILDAQDAIATPPDILGYQIL